MFQKRLLALAGLAMAAGFVVPPAALPQQTRCSRGVSMSASSGSVDVEELAKSLEAAQDGLMANLQEALKVETTTDYPDSLGLAVWEKRAMKGEVLGYKGNTRLVWSGRLKAVSYDGRSFHSETAIWVGPLVQVPHLTFSSSVSPEGVKISLDYVPRDDLAYTTGNSHLRDYYSTPEVRALWDEATAHPLVTARPGPRSFEARVLQSPVALNLVLQPTTEAVEKVTAWTQAHVDRWVSWMGSAEELQRMKRGQMLSRDTGVRRLWVEAGAEAFATMLGGDKEGGKQLAIAVSGPQQQQYVGQAS